MGECCCELILGCYSGFGVGGFECLLGVGFFLGVGFGFFRGVRGVVVCFLLDVFFVRFFFLEGGCLFRVFLGWGECCCELILGCYSDFGWVLLGGMLGIFIWGGG